MEQKFQENNENVENVSENQFYKRVFLKYIELKELKDKDDLLILQENNSYFFKAFERLFNFIYENITQLINSKNKENYESVEKKINSLIPNFHSLKQKYEDFLKEKHDDPLLETLESQIKEIDNLILMLSINN